MKKLTVEEARDLRNRARVMVKEMGKGRVTISKFGIWISEDTYRPKPKTNNGGVVVARVLSSNGKDWYTIRQHAVGRWTCDCMAYRFTKGPVGEKAPCKHMKKLWRDWPKGYVGEAADIRVLRPEAL